MSTEEKGSPVSQVLQSQLHTTTFPQPCWNVGQYWLTESPTIVTNTPIPSPRDSHASSTSMTTPNPPPPETQSGPIVRGTKTLGPSHSGCLTGSSWSLNGSSWSKSYQSGILDNGRMAVLEELGSYIPEVSVEDFIHDYLPTIDVDIDEIFNKLLEDRHITKEGAWSSFTNDPAKFKTGETVVFKPFKGILDIIAEYISEDLDLTPTLEFVDNPSRAPFAERGNRTRPDGYGRLRDKKSIRVPENTEKANAKESIRVPEKAKGKKPVRAKVPVSTHTPTSKKTTKEEESADHWDDICIPFEFKKNNTAVDVADVSLHLNFPAREMDSPSRRTSVKSFGACTTSCQMILAAGLSSA